MKKKFLSIFIAIIICFALGALLETLVFNFKSLTLAEEQKYISNLPYETTEIKKTIEKDGKTETVKNNVIVIKLENQYIKKLIIDNETTDRVGYELSYTFSDLFGKPSEKTMGDFFEGSFPTTVTNINKDVSEIRITYNKNDVVTIKQIDIDNGFHFNYYRFFFVSFILLIIFFIYYFYKDGFRTSKLHIYFAVFSTLAGVAIIAIQPVAAVYSWDDQTHFERVVTWLGGETKYTESEFNITNLGSGYNSINSIEESVYQDEFLGPNKEYDYSTRNGRFTSYGKTPYLPMAIGYHGGKLIGLPFSTCYKLGKLLNLLAFILLVTYAIKTIKAGKRLLLLVSLIPTNLFLACQYSYDPAVFGGVVVFLSQIINLILDKRTKLTFKSLAIMILSITYASLAKAVYAPLLLLFFLIPKEKLQSIKHKNIIRAGIIGVFAMLMSISIFPALLGNNLADSRGGDTSASRQVKGIITHPVGYTTVLGNSMVDQFSNKLFGPGTISTFSYNGMFNSETNFYFILLFVIFFIFLTDNKGNSLNTKQRISIGAIILFVIFAIWNALYLEFTPVGTNTILGVQGRYFLPLIFPTLFILQPTTRRIKINIPDKIYNMLVVTAPIIITIIMTYSFILVPHCL